MADSRQNIETIVKQVVEEFSFELIDLKVIQSGQKLIRGLIDHSQGGITLGDCIRVNKAIVERLNDQDILVDDYTVEINSPGLDRRLKDYKDFLKVKGRYILLWLNEPVEGKTYLEGALSQVTQEAITLDCKQGNFKVSFHKIKVGKEKIK